MIKSPEAYITINIALEIFFEKKKMVGALYGCAVVGRRVLPVR